MTPTNMYPNLQELSDLQRPKGRKADHLKGSPPTKTPTATSPDSPIPEHLKESVHGQSPGFDACHLILPLIAAVAVGCLFVYMYPGPIPKAPDRSPLFRRFISDVDDLQQLFKSQEARTWKSIKSSVQHVLNSTDPGYPAVVLFAVEKGNNLVASCLARRVASLFNKATRGFRDDGYHDMRLLRNLEAAKQKEDLDDKIHTSFKSGRSVVIDHLEALSPQASLLLHGVCDNDNAPFKNVFIGIVFYVERMISASDVDGELTTYLSKDLDIDKIGALLTRINNNAVVIRQEDGDDLSSVCN